MLSIRLYSWFFALVFLTSVGCAAISEDRSDGKNEDQRFHVPKDFQCEGSTVETGLFTLGIRPFQVAQNEPKRKTTGYNTAQNTFPPEGLVMEVDGDPLTMEKIPRSGEDSPYGGHNYGQRPWRGPGSFLPDFWAPYKPAGSDKAYVLTANMGFVAGNGIAFYLGIRPEMEGGEFDDTNLIIENGHENAIYCAEEGKVISAEEIDNTDLEAILTTEQLPDPIESLTEASTPAYIKSCESSVVSRKKDFYVAGDHLEIGASYKAHNHTESPVAVMDEWPTEDDGEAEEGDEAKRNMTREPLVLSVREEAPGKCPWRIPRGWKLWREDSYAKCFRATVAGAVSEDRPSANWHPRVRGRHSAESVLCATVQSPRMAGAGAWLQ